MAASSVSADASAFRTVQPLEYYLKFLTQGVRPDGRALLRARKATSRGGAVSSADGSCMVQLGKTVVIAGVQCEPSVPTQAEPSLGRVLVSLEVSAVASVAASSGGRGSAERQNRELSPLLELLQRTASNELIDLESLCIVEGRAVWSCHCDLYVIEHDGNLTDAALLAMTRALREVRLPRVEFAKAPSPADAGAAAAAAAGSEGGVGGGAEGGQLVVREECAVPLVLSRPLFPLSFALLSGNLLLVRAARAPRRAAGTLDTPPPPIIPLPVGVQDPCAEEEALSSCGFTVLLDAAGQFCALHKPGGAPLSPELVQTSVAAAQQHMPALVALVNE
jgi:exosome complex RNA-binding protein Rrp42 (RNase PH superfamily)